MLNARAMDYPILAIGRSCEGIVHSKSHEHSRAKMTELYANSAAIGYEFRCRPSMEIQASLPATPTNLPLPYASARIESWFVSGCQSRALVDLDNLP